MVGKNLGNGQDGLDAETQVADEEGVRGVWGVRCEQNV